MQEKYKNLPGLTDAETKEFKKEMEAQKEELNRFKEIIADIREYWVSTQGPFGAILKDTQDLIKRNADNAKGIVNSVKDYKNPGGDFHEWFYGSEKKGATKKEKSGFLGEGVEEMGDEFSGELQKMILGYSDFSKSMKKIGSEMTDFLVKKAIDGITDMVFTKENAESVLGIAGGVLGLGVKGVNGLWGKILKIGKHHDGGIIPSGANYSLPGTKEQLAMLKGGERVLSPAESTSYNGNSGGAAPVVFNNFNIKAWDSKDVSKYLLENRQLLNSITFEGIKNNNGQLRTMVQNA